MKTLNHPAGAYWIPELILMIRRCSACGAPALNEDSEFCNQCGARLPSDDLLVCPGCRTTFEDPQSRFCNQCGSPLAPMARVPAPATPATGPEAGVHRAAADRDERRRSDVHRAPGTPGSARRPDAPAGEMPGAAVPDTARGITCTSCGFENPGPGRFYCKRCGAYIPRSALSISQDFVGDGSRPKSAGAQIRILPDGMDELRQQPVRKVPDQPDQPARLRKPQPQTPALPRAEPAKVPSPRPGPAPREKVAGTAAPPQPRTIPPQAPKKRTGPSSWRVAWAAAAVLLLVLVIAVLAVMVTGLTGGGDGGGSAPGSLWGLVPNLSTILNQSVPVVNDTSLNVTPTVT